MRASFRDRKRRDPSNPYFDPCLRVKRVRACVNFTEIRTRVRVASGSDRPRGFDSGLGRGEMASHRIASLYLS